MNIYFTVTEGLLKIDVNSAETDQRCWESTQKLLQTLADMNGYPSTVDGKKLPVL